MYVGLLGMSTTFKFYEDLGYINKFNIRVFQLGEKSLKMFSFTPY